MAEATQAIEGLMPVVIDHTLPAPIVVLHPTVLQHVNDLLRKVEGIKIENDEDFRIADHLHADLRNAISTIEQERKKAKAPVTKLGKEIDGCVKESMTQLQTSAKVVASVVLNYQRDQERKAEEERKKIEAKRAAEAEAERKRLEAEREAEAQKPVTDFPSLEQEAPAPPVEPKPVTQVPATVPVKSTSVRTVRRKKLEIVDAALIPREYLLPDEKAIFEALKAEKEVAGCRLILVETAESKKLA